MVDKKSDEMVELGECCRPHGIKGGFSFHLYNIEDSVLESGGKITLFPKGTNSSIDINGQLIKISNISFGNKVIAYLEGVENRSLAEEMIPFIIKIYKSELPQLEEGEFYMSDLIGINVFELNGEKEIGIIKDYYENGAQTVLTIQLKSGKKIDIPFINEFFPEVDLENSLVRVILPQYI